jgi:LysR family glycine cleavage system transcriptional activator
MSRLSPPLEAIEAFVAVAHAGGLRAASSDLALSPSGASRRIATLEGFLGATLFERSDQGLRLTEAGRRYLNAVEPAVAAIRRATSAVEDEPNRIVLATSHSLAERWIMPRLAALRADETVELTLLPTRDPNVLRSGEAQIAVWGSLDARDLTSETIGAVAARPVMAPHLFDGRTLPTKEAALLDYPLLAPREPGGIWQRWFAAAGVVADAPHIIEYATMALVYEAASAGLGVALAVPMLCEPQLQAGTLVPCGRPMPVGEAYRLYRAGRRGSRSPSETRLVHWLRREARASFDLFASAA